MLKNACALFFFFCMFFSPRTLFAAQEFTTTLTSTYTISSQRTPFVQNEIRIKNNFSTMYSTQFALEVGSTSLKGIRAVDQKNMEIPVNVTQTEKKTTIALQFPDKLLGKNSERVFTIEYENPDAALMTGKVLEVDVPRLAQKDVFQAYTVRVIVPAEYGEPTAAAPANFTKDDAQATDGTRVFVFQNAADNGINLLFGESQQYAFSLRYHLNNPSISQGISQIALPADTAYQKIIYTSIDPRPDNVTRDTDGNWIATYTIGGQKEITVTAAGSATIYLKPTIHAGTNTSVTEKNMKTELQEQPYWETSNPEIQALARKLKTPRVIYDYLTQTYSYDYSRLATADQRRRGAAAALQSPTNVLCQEFTDTFIAIARAAGIPAREVNGYAYTENTRLRPTTLTNDLLHAWPEYYDATAKRWVPIDPTWGSTTGGVDFFSKLDFNHIAFVIHGTSSEKPYSAGMYKITGKEGKDVDVQLTPLAGQPLQTLTVEPPTFLKPNVVLVSNQSGAAWYDVPVAISTSSNLASVGKQVKSLTLAPFEQQEIEIHVDSANILSSFTPQRGTVTVTIGDETTHYETTVGSINPAVAVGVGFGVCTVLAGCVLVFRRKR